MKFVLIKAGGKAEVIELIDQSTIDYKQMKKFLEIDSPVTVVERCIGGKYFDLWVDDEGLFKEERIITGIFVNHRKGTAGEELLCGNMLILKHDNEGNSVGLTDEEIKEVTAPYNIIDMDKLRTFANQDINEDQVFDNYIGFGECIIKAHSQFLRYSL